MNIRVCCVCLLIGIFGLPVNAQISPARLLAGNTLAEQTISADKYFSDLLAARARWPWVDKFEFRTENERLLVNRQDFLFRTSFLGFSRRKFEFLRHNALVETKIADHRQDKYQENYKRFQFVIEMMEKQAKVDLGKARISFHQRLDSLYRIQLAAGGEIDLRDFLRNRESWMDSEKRSQEAQMYLQSMFGNEGFDPNESVDIRTPLSLETIMQQLEVLFVDENAHPDIFELNAEARYLDSEWNNEKAKDRKVLDFAQIRYVTRDDLLLENRFSIGVGINIPWSGASRLRYESIRVKQQETQFEKANRLQVLQRDLAQKKSEAKALYKTYLLYISRSQDASWLDTRTKIEQSGRIHPADLMRLKSHDLDVMEKMNDLYYNLLRTYVEAMYIAGKLDKRVELGK